MDGKRSKIWHFFTKESENKAKCDLCHSLYSIKGGSTTNLNKHLKTKHHPSYDNLFSPALISVPAQLNQQPSTSTSVPAQSNEQPSTSTNERMSHLLIRKKMLPDHLKRILKIQLQSEAKQDKLI